MAMKQEPVEEEYKHENDSDLKLRFTAKGILFLEPEVELSRMFGFCITLAVRNKEIRKAANTA